MSNPNDFINFLQKDKENEMNENVMQKMHRYWVLAGLRQSKENLQKDVDKKDNNYQEYKRQINYLRIQIIKHYLKNTFLFPIWFIRILTPSFFKGNPNIWTNLKQILIKKEFHPLRMAMLSWFAFSYLLIQGGMFYFKHAPSVSAATFTWVQTDWSGNPDGGATATHTDNRTGWTQYSSLSNTYVSSTGQINLTTSTYSITDGTTFSTTGDDTGGDFDSGTNSNTAISEGNAQLAIASQTAVNAWDVGLQPVPGVVGSNAKMIRNGVDDTIYITPAGGSTSFYSYSISANTWTTLAVVPGAVGGGAKMIRNGADNTIYLARGNNTASFYSYSISGNTWTTLTQIYGGRSIAYDIQMLRNGADNAIYLLGGSTGNRSFQSYSISANTWTDLAIVPSNITSGAQIIRNGADDTIYLASEYLNTIFYSYSISANTWTTLAAIPIRLSTGAQMIRNGADNTIYLTSGEAGGSFQSYSISANTWTTLAAVPGAVYHGAQMIRNGADDTIYLARGGNPSSNGFYSYSISANTWTTLAVVPGLVSTGAQMIRNSSDNTIYLAAGNTSTGFYSYSISANTWIGSTVSNLAAVPGTVNEGAKMIRNGQDNTIYLARGDASNGFYSYSISGNTWTTLAVVPGIVGSESQQMIINGGDNTIYLARGYSSTGFYSYSISGNTWTTLAAVPSAPGDHSQMIRNGADDTIYLATGGTGTGFYSYSISANTWTTLAAVPGAVYLGAQMIRNSSDNTIYLAAGGNGIQTTGVDFYSYSISGNTWTTLAAIPSFVGYGAPQMLRNGSDDTIYLARGNASTGFYSYSISANTWTTLAVVPGALHRGAQMLRNGSDDTIYLARAYGSTGFYSYSISGNTWTTLATVPDVVYYGAQMIRASGEDYIYLVRGNDTTGFYRYQINNTTYQTSGTFTSATIDVGATEYGNLSFTSSTVGVGATPVRLQVATNNDNSTWNYVGPDGTGSTYYTNDAGTAIDVGNDATRYLKYKILLQTSDTANTPKVSAVTLGYTGYRPSGTLTSSAFDSTSEANLLSSLAWTENLNTDGDVKFQLRSASTANGLTSATFVGPDGTAGSYFTAPAGTESMPSAFTSGGDDQFFQYQATLTTSNGAITPVLSDTTITYVVNAIPEISGSGVTATQNANGTVTIVYAAYDPDGTVALGDGDGYATPSFQYSLNGTSTSTIVSGLTESGYASATTTHAIGSGWVTSTVIWTPKNEIDGNYTARAWIKVIVNDGEAANNTVSSTSPSFALDVKNPTMGSPSMVVIATTTPATLRLSASDDNSMQMAISLNSDMAGATWQTYATTSTITVDTSPDTVYAQFRDSFANTSTIQSVSTPVTPTNMVIRDISNINTADYKEFVAWAVVALPTPGFSRYDLYKSTGGGAYSLLTSITDRAVNYYVDTVSANITYAYKIAAVDSNGNASQFSSIVSDNADGQGGTDLTAPTITNVNVPISSITTQGFTVTWDTDEISSSSVAYSAAAFGPTFTTTTVHTMTHSSSGVLGAHSVTLSGLTPGVQYFFQVASGDPSGNIVYKNNDGSGYSATTLVGATISGTAVDSVDNTQATITWNSSASADSTVYYSTSATMAGASNVTSATLTTVHSLNITGLTQGTRYYFYVTSGNATDNNAGAYYTFTTTADTVAPTISSISASPVADTTAVITWVTNEGATTQINYGATSGALTSYSTPATGLNLNHTVSLTGLSTATKYYYTVSSLDGSGNAVTSTENNFTTLQTLSEEAAVVAREVAATAVGTTAGTEAAGGGGGFPYNPPSDNIPPVISGTRMSNVKSETATIEWATDEAGDSLVEYGKDEKYGSYFFDLNRVNNHSITLTRLTPSIKYNYRVTSEDKSGNRAFSGNQTFTTISGFEEINTLQELGSQGTPEEGSPEAIFTDLIGKTADIIRRMSGQVSLQTLETGLATQYATIRELGRLVPLPLIGGQPVVEVGGTYARIFWTTDKPASSLVAVAPDSTYTNNQEYTQVIGDASTLVENHEVLLSELKPNTLYHYQVRSKTPVSDTAKSRDFTFKTKEEQIEIITYKIDKTSDTEALFSWTTNVPTDSKVTYIPYGSDGKILIDSLKTSSDKNMVTSHNVTVKDLEGGPTYQIELSGEDAGGNVVSKTISTFSTSEIDAPPVITQVQTDSALIPGAQVAVQAIISWITNEPATSQIFYQRGFGKTNEKKEFTQKTALDPNYIKRHIMVITNFDSGAVYQFQVESMDSSGNTTRSKTYTILTPRQKESVFQVIMGSMEETFSWVGKVGL